ncbi:MAG TPA: hypothetical protein VH560_15455, partial [Polyangia bacterium]|nr:hypothetical protein [Polyangia bacterium]
MNADWIACLRADGAPTTSQTPSKRAPPPSHDVRARDPRRFAATAIPTASAAAPNAATHRRRRTAGSSSSAA